MEDAHLARLAAQDPSQALPKEPSRAFIAEYVKCFSQNQTPSEAGMRQFVSLIAGNPELYDVFLYIKDPPAPLRFDAAANFAYNVGCFPELSGLPANSDCPGVYRLLKAILAKNEAELLLHREDLFAFALQVRMQAAAAIPYLKQLLARARFGANQPLPLFFLRKLLPRKFEGSSSVEVYNIVFQIYKEVCGPAFDATSVVFNLFYFENGRSALKWADFKVDLHIFNNLKTCTESLLFIARKLDSEDPREMRYIVLPKMLKLLFPEQQFTTEYRQDEFEWQEDLIEDCAVLQIQAAQLLLIQKLARIGEFAELLPQFNQVQQFCNAHYVPDEYIRNLKRLYAENGCLQVFWQEQPFYVCLAALFSLHGSYFDALQLIYIAFVGRAFQYYILTKEQHVEPGLFEKALQFSKNVQEGVFLAYCSQEQRDNYRALQSMNYLIPVQRDARHIALRLLYSLNQLKQRYNDSFDNMFSNLLRYGQYYQIILEAYKRGIKVVLPKEFFIMDRSDRRMVVAVLYAVYNTIKDKRIGLLIGVLQHERSRGHILLENARKVLFHPRMALQLSQNYDLLKMAISSGRIDEAISLTFALQVSEHLYEQQELYLLCNGPLFLLALFTGDFDNPLQLELAKMIIHLQEALGSSTKLYSYAFTTVAYDENAYYSRFAEKGRVIRNIERAVDKAGTYCPELQSFAFPIVCGSALFQLLKQSSKQGAFNFDYEVCFECNYGELRDATEAEFCQYLKSSDFDSLRSFQQRNFTVPSIFGLRLLFTSISLENFSNIVRVRYERSDIFDLLKGGLRSRFGGLRRALEMDLGPRGQRQLSILLNSGVQAVWREISRATAESDIYYLCEAPYRLMNGFYRSQRYAEVLSLYKACGLEGLRNIYFK